MIVKIDDKKRNKENQKKYKRFSSAKSINKNIVQEKPSFVPVTKDKVYDSYSNELILKSELAKGGEAIIYDVEATIVAKIFKERSITNVKRIKIASLIDFINNANPKGVCLPSTALYNSNGEFVGYSMKKVDGVPLKRLFSPSYIEENFNDWTLINLYELCLTLANTLKKVHSFGLVIGDLNPLNILVQDQYSVELIDVDSWQILSYPSDVGMFEYTKQSHQGKSFTAFLRNENDDIYALMTIIFQLLFQGMHPISHKQMDGLYESLKKGYFPYDCKENENANKAPNSTLKIWKKKNQLVRSMFCEVFRKKRDISIDQIIKVFELSLKMLKKVSLVK